MTENPYSAPVSESEDSPHSYDEGRRVDSGWAHAKSVFLAWEKLRFLYNFVLIFIVVAMAVLLGGAQLLSSIEFWLMAIVGGVISNICFFVGPIVESYVHWLGLRLTWLRSTCFLLGLALTTVVALLTVAELAWSV